MNRIFQPRKQEGFFTHPSEESGHTCVHVAHGIFGTSRCSSETHIHKSTEVSIAMSLSGWWFGCHEFCIFPLILGQYVIIPIDEVIFFRGVAEKPPTSQISSRKLAPSARHMQLYSKKPLVLWMRLLMQVLDHT